MIARALFVSCALLAGFGTSGCFAYCPLYATSGCLERADVDLAGRTQRAPQLRGFLEDDRSWVREAAAQAVGRHHVTSLEPDVVARLQDEAEPPWVRAAAARALARLPSLTAIGPLQGLARRPDVAPELGLAVLEALCQLAPATPETDEALRRLAQDPDVLVAAAAIHRRSTGCGS